MTFTKEISIPADTDGYVLLQCPLCDDFFKLQVDELQAEDTLEIWCPCCGLKSESYLTEDVLELAQIITQNYAEDLLYNELKKMERKLSGKFITFKVSSKPKPKFEPPILHGIQALEVVEYCCCKKSAKVAPLGKMIGTYCSYCGVRQDGCY